MEVSESDVQQAEARMQVLRSAAMRCPHATALAEGLAGAAPGDLAEIEISPAGLGLHWPRLDADLYVPALLQGVFGSQAWMARLALEQQKAACWRGVHTTIVVSLRLGGGGL
ncbi:MAG: DUF2442 domain-containing protein [Actinomycetaceae bacterium]|nr:DUF2442 domain-containing protein [Actinomycetaceae bacterium]